jgi:predicted O-methyltransferase YrrM
MNTIYEPYWFNYQDFYKFVSTHNYKTFVELGVWLGHSVSFLAKHLEYGSVIYAIDLFDDSYAHKNYDHLNGLRYELFKKNTAEYKHIIKPIHSCSWVAADMFENQSVDFVFIDADHSYESVCKDIDGWLSKIKKGGILAGHDYFNADGVKLAVDTKLNDVKIYGSCWYKYI